MPNPNQSSATSPLILGGWIFSGISLLAVGIGITLCVTARPGNVPLSAILTATFGGLGLVIGLIVLFTARQQAKNISALSKAEGEIWARWNCSPDEAARFLAVERKRLTITRGQLWVGLLVALGFALVVLPVLAVFVRGYTLDLAFMVWSGVVCLGLAGLFWLIASFTQTMELKRTTASATGETLIGPQGLATGETYWPWRGFNLALRHVAVQPGDPSVIEFTFLIGTFPGAALVGEVGRVAYVLVDGPAIGATQKTMKVRVPVPGGREGEALALAATLMGHKAPELSPPAILTPVQQKEPQGIQSLTSAALTNKEEPRVMSSGIFIFKNDEQLGPLEESEVRSRIAAGSMTPDDLAWQEGMTDWVSLRQLYPDLVTPPPPPRRVTPPPPPIRPAQNASTPAAPPSPAAVAIPHSSPPPPTPMPVAPVTPASTPLPPSPPIPPAPVPVATPLPPPSAAAPPAPTKSNFKKIASAVGAILLISFSLLTGVHFKKKGGTWQVTTPKPTATPRNTSTTAKTSAPAKTSAANKTSDPKVAEGVKFFDDEKWDDAFRVLKPAADRGDAEAQYYIGVLYNDGQGVAKNQTEGTNWFRKSAVQGYAWGQCALGVSYRLGQGIQKDDVQAANWFRKAADQGLDIAQFDLGVMYEKGWGVTQDAKQAFVWYLKAAQQDYPDAQNNLASFYLNGSGVQKDLAQALVWYRKAAENDNPTAHRNLGVMYEQGLGVSQDLEQARVWYEKADELGDPDAKADLARLKQR